MVVKHGDFHPMGSYKTSTNSNQKKEIQGLCLQFCSVSIFVGSIFSTSHDGKLVADKLNEISLPQPALREWLFLPAKYRARDANKQNPRQLSCIVVEFIGQIYIGKKLTVLLPGLLDQKITNDKPENHLKFQ